MVTQAEEKWFIPSKYPKNILQFMVRDIYYEEKYKEVKGSN